MTPDLTETLTENGFTVWKAIDQPDEKFDDRTVLLTNGDEEPLVARFVEGRKDEAAVHVEEISNPSKYDVMFVSVDTGEVIVIDPSRVSNSRPRIPFDKPSPLKPVELSDWLSKQNS